jgi:site-specific DNA-methyltransferase (adenine-specific)
MRKEVIGRHTLYCGDCLEIMPALPARSIDIVLTDAPYLLINADWDKELDIESVIENIERLLSENSAFVFFGRGDSFYKWNVLANKFSKFKEEVIWDKTANSNPMATPQLLKGIIYFSRFQDTIQAFSLK